MNNKIRIIKKKVWIETKKDTEMELVDGIVKNPVHTYEEARALIRTIETKRNKGE